jgi:hypothetical protein
MKRSTILLPVCLPNLVLIVISTQTPSPLATAQALFTLPSVYKRGFMDPAVCVQYLVLHDPVSSPNVEYALFNLVLAC